MCEVTRKNFEKIYPEIIQDLKSATFISIDCEFSGLFDDTSQCSLFDNPKARFIKLQNCLENFLIIQFGLTTYKYERTDNSFSASTYNFYIKPPNILVNQKFTWQVGSIDFLCTHNFNFNTLFYEGINYLNKSYEKDVLKMIEDGSLITHDFEKNIQMYCSKIAEWSGSASEGDEMILELNDENETFIYLLHDEIRKRFPKIWTYLEEVSAMKIKKLNYSEKILLISNPKESLHLKNKLFDSILGFSRIIREIQNLKKPIIGHNFLLDLIKIYKQFFNPSPISYKEFKRAISDIFPNVFDTKTISFKLKDCLTRDNTWNSNILPDLYSYFKEGKGATVVIFSPLIKPKNEDFIKSCQFHNAGFDSYCTGFCFVKMAHMFSLWEEQKKSFLLTSLPITTSWLLGAVAPMKNQVNMSRGQVKYIVLDGKDPKSVRPGLLYIQSKTKQPLEISKISGIIAKYASVDIQLLTKYDGLMAVANQKQVKEILECFERSTEFSVTKYNFKYSNLVKTILPVAIIASLVFTMCASKGWTKLRF